MKHVANILRIMLLIGLILLFIFPFVWMVSTSFKTYVEAIQFPPDLLPHIPQFGNYLTTWSQLNFFHYALNSAFITITTGIGQLLVCVPAAYAFAKKRFKLSGLFFVLVLIDLILPAQVTFVPIYVVVSNFGWLDTYWALTVPFLYSSFAIFFMTQAFRQIPDELLEAAKLDKASELQIIARILIPMAKPVVLTAMLFNCISRWNDYFWPLILTNSEAVRTLPMSVANLLSAGSGVKQWNILMAGNMMLLAPVLILYLLANRFIKSGFVYSTK